MTISFDVVIEWKTIVAVIAKRTLFSYLTLGLRILFIFIIGVFSLFKYMRDQLLRFMERLERHNIQPLN